jgi:hypothetical protein
MQDITFRAGGAAAMAGGALRIANAFTSSLLEPRALGFLYLATDILLLLGLVAWFIARRATIGVVGAAGFALAVAGFLAIRSAGLFGANGYAIGVEALLLGLAVMSLPMLIHREGPIVPPALWLLTLVVGLTSLVFAPAALLAAILFGLAFIAAGFELWREAGR